MGHKTPVPALAFNHCQGSNSPGITWRHLKNLVNLRRLDLGRSTWGRVSIRVSQVGFPLRLNYNLFYLPLKGNINSNDFIALVKRVYLKQMKS